ncbi:hypothetical protein VUR80DRAFT_9335 [Thermomyces stellatus]
MGSAVGHKLAHVVNSDRGGYDASGHMTVRRDDGAMEALTERVAYFAEQYGGFAVSAEDGTEIPVNGETLAKSIAYTGGLVSASKHKRSAKHRRRTQGFPGFGRLTPWTAVLPWAGQTISKNMPPGERVRYVLDQETRNRVDARNSLTLEKLRMTM